MARVACTSCEDSHEADAMRVVLEHENHEPTAVCVVCGDEWAERVYRSLNAD